MIVHIAQRTRLWLMSHPKKSAIREAWQVKVSTQLVER